MYNQLYKAMAVSGSLMLGIMALSPVTLAQSTTNDKTELEEVVVTGSILRRTDDAPSPVTIMTDEWMKVAGINNVSEAMQRLPANNAGTITNNWNVGYNFATGATAPSLRGLTVQNTLSIVDGLRMAPYPLADDGQRNFVDLNTIPNNTIKRIEVLRDGASSTYGADAVAGVVNVITLKEIQGIHAKTSYGWAEHGGGEETNLDFAWGFGDLGADGSNFYIAGEYLKQDAVAARQRAYPFNTQDWSRKCGPSGSCMPNLNWNGMTAEDGSFNGFYSVPGVTFVRPVGPGETSGAAFGTGQYEYLNPAAGCRDWPTVDVPADQMEATSSPSVNCEVDFQKKYMYLSPDIDRKGLTMRYTANVNDATQFYAMMNYYITKTSTTFTPLGFNGTPPPPRAASVTVYNVLLPVYVCSAGVGTQSGEGTGCDASNGQLNPYNPYAAEGLRAQVSLRSPREREIRTESRAYRVAFGLDGSFADDWRYTANFTASEVGLTRDSAYNFIPQSIMNEVATGGFNFYDPASNPQAVWDRIAPMNSNYSVSRLWQVQGTIAKDLMELSGGALQAAVGVSYRDESINAPSANPANDSAPYSRYYGLNAVGTAGSRDVTSVFFEVDAPITETFDVIASGRYDDYSSGQSNFSPKVGLKFEPVDAVILRGTWSQGFRIPSFNEAYGLPTTGYVTRRVDCETYADFCAAHAGNAYAMNPYDLGLTQVGDPALNPEKSDSYTVGIIWKPMESLQITLDFWQIKIDGLITGVTDTSQAEAQYYANNGNVDLPGITVLPGTPDSAYPDALPLAGFIQSAYVNQDSQKVAGIDFGATYMMPIGSVEWTSILSLSYLAKYDLTTDDGDKLKYAGTLSPCNNTSCSGSPELRGYWTNSFQFNEKTSASLTTYYTSSVDNASVDFGGVKGDCEASINGSVVTYVDGTPVLCKSKAQWNIDLTAQYQLNDQVQLFADFLNVFDIKPEFDPSAAYSLYGFNPAWAGPNIMGRFIRLGVRLDFD